MADEKKLVRAQEVYGTMCRSFDEQNWSYEKAEEDLVILTGFQSADIPIQIVLRVIPEGQLILLTSLLPFEVPEEKRLDLVMAVDEVNKRLGVGHFDYDIRSGEIGFRMPSAYVESEVGPELFVHMIRMANQIVDDFNDKFLMLAKGMMSIQEFFALFAS